MRDLKNPLSPTPNPSFRTAFSSAKKSGKKTFNWKNSEYTTETAEEKGQNLINKAKYKELEKASNKANYNMNVAHGVEGKPLGKDLQKSTKEINDSYNNIIMNGIEGSKKTTYGRKSKK